MCGKPRGQPTPSFDPTPSRCRPPAVDITTGSRRGKALHPACQIPGDPEKNLSEP